MLMTGGLGLDVQDLRARLAGTIAAPGDSGWDDARRAWNLAIDQRPALVALPENVDDVVAIVEFARRNGLRVAAQGTGHNAAALASLERTVLVKTSRMKGVAIDAVGRCARVAAGTLWAEVTGPASEHGLAPLAGSSPDVGVVGYTLGGGLSWLSRRHGLAANSVIAIEIVTADGRVVRCDRDHEPALFWALRGGGGGFGIVTAIEFALYPAPEVYVGAMLWPWGRAAEIINRYVEWCRTAPDAVSTSIRLLQVPPLPDVPEALQGRSFVAIDGAYLGSEADAVAALAPLRALDPEFDFFAPIPPAALSHIHMDPEHPVPTRGDGMILDRLTPAAIDALVEAVGPGSGSPLLMVELRQLGGAIGVPPAEHGALAKIGGEFALFAVGIPMDADAAAAIAAYLDGLTAALDPWDAGRRYPNFTERPADAREFFPQMTLARLQAVKLAYDRDGMFLASHPVMATA